MEEAIQILGFHMTLKPLDVRTKLPLLYNENYSFFIGTFAEQKCILLQYHGVYLSISRIENHFRDIPKLLNMNLPCVLWMKKATDAQQARLYDKQIPFIVDDKTIFLPQASFLSVGQNTRQHIREFLPNKQFTPAEQCVYLWLMYQDSRECRVGEIIENLRLSQASVSRALMNLYQRSLLDVYGRNTRKKYRRIDLRSFWNKGRTYLMNPVQRRYYIDADKVIWKDISYAAGESALANLSMLSEPVHVCRAVENKYSDIIAEKAAVSPDDLHSETFSIIEIWRYDPKLFVDSQNNVDLFSLYASLGDLLNDERVAGEMEIMIERYLNDAGN